MVTSCGAVWGLVPTYFALTLAGKRGGRVHGYDRVCVCLCVCVCMCVCVCACVCMCACVCACACADIFCIPILIKNEYRPTVEPYFNKMGSSCPVITCVCMCWHVCWCVCVCVCT